MIVVSDTTPLISFLKIDSLDILQKLFGEIQIPKEVFKELTENNNFFEEAKKIRNCEFIKVISVAKNDVLELQNETGLDAGECEAIVLAKNSNAELLLIDEAKGRTVAKNKNLKITGTIGILLLAKENGLLSQTELTTIAQTLRNSGRFISENLFEKLL